MSARRSSPFPPASARDIVIKVKCGNTLKRFNVHLSEGSLDQTWDELKAKIIKAFKLGSDMEFVMTYVDVDGDDVLLDDDEDLCDAVVRQGLDPLRIELKLKKATNGGASEPQMGTQSSLPKAMPLEEHISVIKTTIIDALKSIPDAQKLSQDVISAAAAAAASSVPAVAEIVQQFSKLASPNSVQTSEVPAGHSDTTESKCPGQADAANSVPTGNKADGKACSDHSKGKSPKTFYTPIFPPGPYKSECKRKFWGPPMPPPYMAPAYGPWAPRPFCGRFPTFHGHPNSSHNDGSMWSTSIPPSHPLQSSMLNNGYSQRKSGSSAEEAPLHKWVQCDICGVEPIVGPRYKSSVKDNYDLCSMCFTQHGNEADYIKIDRPAMLHRFVKCDGCGISPIVGSRYKSNVRDNYDLCGGCFSQFGNDVEYTRIDMPPAPIGRTNNIIIRPRFNAPARVGSLRVKRDKMESRFIQDITVLDGTVMQSSTPFTKIWRMRNNGGVTWPFGTQLTWIGGDHFSNSNSVFLEISPSGLSVDEEIDIAVDFVAPEKPGRYISYWRLLSPTGQKFGQRVWVLIQVEQPVSSEVVNLASINLNVPPEGSGLNEIDMIDVNVEPRDSILADDFTTNEVVSEDAAATLSKEANVQNSSKHAPKMTTVLAVAPDAGIDDASSSAPQVPAQLYPVFDFEPYVSSVAPNVVVDPRAVKYPDDESVTSVPQMTSAALTPPPAAPLMNYPLVDLTSSGSSDVPPVLLAPSFSSAPAAFATATAPFAPAGIAETVDSDNLREEALLKELEMMGFRQVDLNKEVLRQNNYNLEQSVDELCGYNEWDPLLNDLQEMGFNDDEMNRKMLEKNSGSITRAVMDLVAREKAE